MHQFDQAAAGRVRAAAQQAVEEHHLPGIAVGVVEGDELVLAEGFGFADIEGRQPQDPARRQRIASITKTMVGLCTMALVDEGRLSLDDGIVDRLPDARFEGPGNVMTVRHLLTHTSGIGEAPTLADLAQNVDPNFRRNRAPGSFGDLYPDGIIVDCPAGEKWAYCNHGYALLGEIIVRAEGVPLHEVLRRRVFEPLGMADSDLHDEEHPRLTTGYHRPPSDDNRELLERAGLPVPEETPVDGYNIRGRFQAEGNAAMRAAGGVQSTIPDMARYAAALLQRGAGIVRPETFDAMVAPQWCPDDRLASWGLSFHRGPMYGRRTLGHGGAFFGGWNSNLTVIADEGLAIIQHMNIMLDDPAPAFNRVIRAVLDAREPAAVVSATAPTILDSAPGMYECTPGRLTNFRPATRYGRIHIERHGDKLLLQSRRGPWKQAAPMRPAVDPDLFFVDVPDGEPERIVLTRDTAGRVAGLRFDDLVHMVRSPQSHR